MNFAADTKVSVSKTRMEIEELLQRAGAAKFASSAEPGKASVLFELKDRRIMFELVLPKAEAFATKKVRGYTRKCSPDEAQKLWEQACRSRWRALFLTIKSKLVSAEAGIETLEEAFLPHIVVPGVDGRSARFATLAIKAIQETYARGTPPLLESGT